MKFTQRVATVVGWFYVGMTVWQLVDEFRDHARWVKARRAMRAEARRIIDEEAGR